MAGIVATEEYQVIPGNFPSDSERPQSFPITAAQVRHSSSIAAVHGMVKALDQGLVPTADVICALVSKDIDHDLYQDLFRAVDPEDQNPDDPMPDRAITEKYIQEFPWPESTQDKPSELLRADNMLLKQDKTYIYYFIKPGVSKTFPYGISTEEGTCDFIEEVMQESYAKLPENDQKRVMEWIIELHEKGYDMPMGTSLFIIQNKPQSRELFLPIADYLIKHKLLYKYPQKRKTEMVQRSDDEVAHNAYLDDDPKLAEAVIEKVLDHPEGEQRELIGMALNYFEYPLVIDAIRAVFSDGKLPQEKQSRLESLGKQLLGIDPHDEKFKFHATLNSVYDALKDFFKDYPTNLEANNFELDLIKRKVDEIFQSGKRAVVVDLGCGTGRIANGLAVKGMEGKVIGIDSSPDNLAIAEADYAETAAQGGKTEVEYKRGDWLEFKNVWNPEKRMYEWKSDLGIAPASADVVLTIGRTLTHAEDYHRLATAFKQVNVVLKEGGLFIFDFPDPNKGAYVDNRRHLLQTLQAFGADLKEEDLNSFEYVADSADGKNLYNRYVPQIETIKELLDRQGFDLVEMVRAPIAGELWQGSENVYFTARKRSHKFTSLKHYSRQDQTEFS